MTRRRKRPVTERLPGQPRGLRPGWVPRVPGEGPTRTGGEVRGLDELSGHLLSVPAQPEHGRLPEGGLTTPGPAGTRRDLSLQSCESTLCRRGLQLAQLPGGCGPPRRCRCVWTATDQSLLHHPVVLKEM